MGMATEKPGLSLFLALTYKQKQIRFQTQAQNGLSCLHVSLTLLHSGPSVSKTCSLWPSPLLKPHFLDPFLSAYYVVSVRHMDKTCHWGYRDTDPLPK